MKSLRVAVIGGGPAGLSAALWLKNLGATPTVIEKEAKTGGMQNFNFLTNDWVLGQSNMTGVAVADNFYQHILAEDIDLRLQSQVVNFFVEDSEYHLGFENGDKVVCDAIILANGTRYVGREILPENLELAASRSPHIIEGPHAFVDIEACRQQRIVIIGAGDNAFENALMLLQLDCHVMMVSRSVPKAQKRFVDQVMEHSAFTLFDQTVVTGIELLGEQLQVSLSNHSNDVLLADRLHILAGYQSNLNNIATLIEQGVKKKFRSDDNQFLLVDESGRTSIDHIYAAGDICNTHFPCVVSAVASGALAAKTLTEDLS